MKALTEAKKNPRFDLIVPLKTRMKFLVAKDTCEYCGKADDIICCVICGTRKLRHSKNGYSIAHTCFHCNLDMGKGE